MNKILKKAILLLAFFGSLSTVMLTWSDIRGVQTLNGIQILTGNVVLSALIVCLYCVSVLFYEKNSKIFFCTGLSSLSMLFAIMFSKFENWGRFTNNCVGPYVGLCAVILTIVLFVFLNTKDKSNVK
ncbi:MAG: hypothetical protein E7672_01570 [Ruminococcaceae bacterium]|nr:hypothetical protein [Oscillospiraceae bacterium]